MSKKIIIIGGDPNSINSEIIYKSWKKIKKSLRKKICIISNFKLLKSQYKKLNYPVKLNNLLSINENCDPNKINVIDEDLIFDEPFKVPIKQASKFILKCLTYGHNLALKKNVIGIINCAIDKRLIGKNNLGVTEYLAFKCGIKDNSEVMLIRNEKYSVCPLTTHIDVKKISKKITSSLIFKKINTIDNFYKKFFKKKVRIGILGLNPHNAELRKNSEERKIIIPAILKLRKKRINIIGPIVSDTVFISDFRNYDVIVGMYHDQVLSPFKAIFKFNAINVTLGLKYLRVSPDHGTALKLAGKNKSNPESLLKCINFINKFGK